MPDGNPSKKQSCPIKVRTAFESDLREPPPRLQPMRSARSARVFRAVQLTRRIRTDLGAIAASHNIRYPVLHHDGKIRPFIPLPKAATGLPAYSKPSQYRQ
jgi:hypothetical protein